MDFTIMQAGQSKEMPAKTVLYGVPKIGKSCFAAQYPSPFFINVEGGLEYLPVRVRCTPKLSSFDEVMAWLMHIYTSDDVSCETLVFDSLDWIEALAQQKISEQHLDSKGNPTALNNQAYKPFAYNKGFEMAADEAKRVFAAADNLYLKKGVKSLFIAHSQVKTVDVPDKDPYQQHQMKLSKGLAAKAYEWADLVLFANFSFVISSEGKTTEPKRVLCAGGSAAFLGGGRMTLSKELPMDYSKLKEEICK